LCHQIKTREKFNMFIKGVETKRDKFKRIEREAIVSMLSMSSHQHAHDSVHAPKSALLMRHNKVKKATGGLFQAREQHDAQLNMPVVHEAANTKRLRILMQIKERQASFAHSKQQRGSSVSDASMGGAGAIQAMYQFRHAQEAMVQARNRLLAHQMHTLHQKEQLQLARRSPLVEGYIRHHQYAAVLDACASAASFASLEHTIAMRQQALYYQRSAVGWRTQQLYPADDGAQQRPPVRPATIGGAGSCTHSVVHSQGFADHVVVRDTTKQALFESIPKKQALKQEVGRLAEKNRQLAEAVATIEDSTMPGSTSRAADRSASMSLYPKMNASTSRLHTKSSALEDVAMVTRNALSTSIGCVDV
jgi:hypothetical protein